MNIIVHASQDELSNFPVSWDDTFPTYIVYLKLIP